MYDIKFINSTEPVVDYSENANTDLQASVLEYSQIIDRYTALFESQFAELINSSRREDIGGLIVYSRAGEVSAVYDYENFYGWVV